MRIVDVTVDFETVGLGNNAALIELAATEWNRDAECSDDIFMDSFMQRIDLTSAVFNGREFETSTIKWWQSKPDAVKAAILSEQCYPEKEVLENFAAWLEECGKSDDAEVVLWAQGSDFDIAILRNRCKEYGIKLPVHFHNFRDARTYILEGFIAENGDAFRQILQKDFYYMVYKTIPEYKKEGEDLAHEALFDSERTSWSVWHVMHGQTKEVTVDSVTVK